MCICICRIRCASMLMCVDECLKFVIRLSIYICAYLNVGRGKGYLGKLALSSSLGLWDR